MLLVRLESLTYGTATLPRRWGLATIPASPVTPVLSFVGACPRRPLKRVSAGRVLFLRSLRYGFKNEALL